MRKSATRVVDEISPATMKIMDRFYVVGAVLEFWPAAGRGVVGLLVSAEGKQPIGGSVTIDGLERLAMKLRRMARIAKRGHATDAEKIAIQEGE